jgi:hypothetical protein
MRFIVKVASPAGVVGWLSQPNERAVRTIVEQELAAVFPTSRQAQLAIDTLPLGPEHAGIKFSIESAE